jgi:hypothetical protein
MENLETWISEVNRCKYHRSTIPETLFDLFFGITRTNPGNSWCIGDSYLGIREGRKLRQAQIYEWWSQQLGVRMEWQRLFGTPELIIIFTVR